MSDDAPSTPTVLVVDDDPQVLRVVRRILGGQALIMIEAESLTSAIALAATTTRIDLLLTDCVMPGGSGVEVARRLRETWPDLRVLYMSGYDAERFLEQGVAPDRFVRKPFSVPALREAVGRALAEEVVR